LLGGRFQEAEDIYNKLINDEKNSSQRPAILYRLSQLEFKRGNNQQANDYLSKLRRDFPLSPELKLNRELILIDTQEAPKKDTGEYSVQVGFFSSSSNANNLKDKLSAGGFPAYIENSGSAYRVKVGRLKSLKDAQDLESRLSKEGFQTKIYP
jgi:tetratricopeptide (TPR) repeat protein